MKRPSLLLAALVFAAAAPAADPAPVAPEFFNAAGFDWRPLLAPPPAEGSIAALGERELAGALDAARTPEQAALAASSDLLRTLQQQFAELGEVQAATEQALETARDTRTRQAEKHEEWDVIVH